MASRLQRILQSLDLEERILNGAAFFSLIALFFPWLSGEWIGGETVNYTGLSFYTSFIGMIIFILLLFLLALTAVPLLGGPIVLKRRQKEITRLCVASQITILTLAALSVLTEVTYEFSRIEIRFGIYSTLVGSLIATLYSFLKWQEYHRQEAQDLFRHPEDPTPLSERQETISPLPPPPAPPPPLPPEEHHLRP